jgi:signal transduction histidine kinase
VGQAAISDWRVDEVDAGPASYDRALAELAALRRAIASIPDGMVITAHPVDGSLPRVIFANAAFYAMLGGPGGDAADGLAFPSSAKGHADENPLWISLKKSHLSDGVYTDEISCRGKAGNPTLLHLNSEPVHDESRQITHRIAVIRDETERAAIEELIHRNERLACIGLLAAGIAHEINNPTGAALLAAETALAIKDLPGAGDRLTACLQNIVTSMDRCGRIVRTLLRYTRHEPTEKQACNVNDVVEQAMDLARPYGSAHGANLQLQLDSTIPLVSMNPLEIELVLVNLIRNAIEAGGGNVEVCVATSQAEWGVRVAVRDSGCGMNDEQLAHVFDPLYTTRRHVGGSGLGMTIAHDIVREHQGHLEVRSREGIGTTVIIDLPAALASCEDGGQQKRGSYESNPDCGHQSVLRRHPGLRPGCRKP